MKDQNQKNNQKGISIYIAIIILGIVSGIVFGLVVLFLGQIKTLRNIGDSTMAFYLADSGVEHSLFNLRKEGGNGLVSGSLDANNQYVLFSCGGNCVISRGTFNQKIQRAIQINF
ncbi:MAG: hypothetical protein Q8O39_01055 [bacterium]|nr:hypothetical protein [bacterium]